MVPPIETNGAQVRPAHAALRLLPFDPATFARVIGRAALLWLLVRVAFTGLLAAGNWPVAAGPVAPRVLLVVVVVVLCAIDGRASREPVFHANLGMGDRTVLALSTLTAGTLELAAGLLLAALTR